MPAGRLLFLRETIISAVGYNGDEGSGLSTCWRMTIVPSDVHMVDPADVVFLKLGRLEQRRQNKKSKAATDMKLLCACGQVSDIPCIAVYQGPMVCKGKMTRKGLERDEKGVRKGCERGAKGVRKG